MMNADQGWVNRMHLARHQTQWRQGMAERRRADRRNEWMAEAYAAGVRRERAVRRAYADEEARRRRTTGRLGLSEAERIRRYELMDRDRGVQTRNSGQVYGVR
jgi:hypothetical protein